MTPKEQASYQPGGWESPAADAGACRATRWIGRQRVEKNLGQGGFGVVYLAYDDQLQRTIAVEVPHGRLLPRPEDAPTIRRRSRRGRA